MRFFLLGVAVLLSACAGDHRSAYDVAYLVGDVLYLGQPSGDNPITIADGVSAWAWDGSGDCLYARWREPEQRGGAARLTRIRPERVRRAEQLEPQLAGAAALSWLPSDDLTVPAEGHYRLRGDTLVAGAGGVEVVVAVGVRGFAVRPR